MKASLTIVQVDTMSRKLTKKQDLLNQLEQKQKKKDANSEGDYSEDSDDGVLLLTSFISN